MSGKSLPAAVIRERQRTGATLRALRIAAGITPDDLANKVGRSRPFLANIEAGRKRLPDNLVEPIAEILGVPAIVFAHCTDIISAAA